jgi:dihydrofolate reductase
MSLDGYVAGPKEELDWIVMDPEIDFAALYARFDTAIMGRKTYDWMLRHDEKPGPLRTILVSRSATAERYPGVTIWGNDAAQRIAAMKGEAGKDIWLFGGGELFRSLAAAGLVDVVEVAIMPVMIGGGISLLPSPAERVGLRLRQQKVYASGIVILSYDVAK